MKKALLIGILFVAMIASITIAEAATFDGKAGEIAATVADNTATITVTGVGDIAYIEQYRTTNADGKGWILRHPVQGGKATLDPYEGDRIQLVNTDGKWLFISPEWCVTNYRAVQLKGVNCECSSPNGCALQLK